MLNVSFLFAISSFFDVFLKLPHFTLLRKSKASQWLLPEQLPKPAAGGREGAMFEAILLLPAVAWVSWWLLTEDPASQTVAIAPYAIHPSSVKALPAHEAVENCSTACSFSAQQNKSNKPSSLTLQICTSPERLHFVFCAAFKKAKFSSGWLATSTDPPHSPHINIPYCFPFYFKLIPHASWLINFVNKKEMILRYPNVLQIITVDSSYV